MVPINRTIHEGCILPYDMQSECAFLARARSLLVCVRRSLLVDNTDTKAHKTPMGRCCLY